MKAPSRSCASDAQGLCAQRADHLVNDAVLQGLLGVEVLVAVEVKLNLHIQRWPSVQWRFHMSQSYRDLLEKPFSAASAARG